MATNKLPRYPTTVKHLISSKDYCVLIAALALPFSVQANSLVSDASQMLVNLSSSVPQLTQLATAVM